MKRLQLGRRRQAPRFSQTYKQQVRLRQRLREDQADLNEALEQGMVLTRRLAEVRVSVRSTLRD